MPPPDALSPPEAVLEAWALTDADRITPITIGLINRTFLVQRGPERRILQRLHPVFDASVHLDIEAVTRRLEAQGVPTPRLVPTRRGALWVEAPDGVWRVLTYLEGEIRTVVEGPEMARAAGRLVARFHAALADLRHVFQFERVGVHDTAQHLARLADALTAHRDHPHFDVLAPLAEAVLTQADGLHLPGPLPTRIIHGDLKITNVLFAPSLREARALIDLDTLGHGTLATELGDALRSWCNPAGESAEDAEVSVPLFAASVEGYAEGCRGRITSAEIHALRSGMETIATELASRFCLDAFDDRYFGWDPTRFASRREHNLARARSQLSLARSVRAQTDALEAAVARAFAL
jgi:Ser/Thr protein kinase RdoA (MazF antagonist)